MDETNVRYFIEHKLFPNMFYNEKLKFVGFLVDNKINLVRFIRDIYKKHDMVCPHNLKDYKAELIKISEEVLAVKLTFPEPERVPLCYKVFMFFDTHLEKLLYITYEKGESCTYICNWPEEGVHANNGVFVEGEDDELIKALIVYYVHFNLSLDDPRYALVFK